MPDPERIREGSVTRSLRISILATLLVTTVSHRAKVFVRLLLQVSMSHFAIFGS